MCRSPKLIAACHVLHRLLAPRHSRCALQSLIPCLRKSEMLPCPEGISTKSSAPVPWNKTALKESDHFWSSFISKGTPLVRMMAACAPILVPLCRKNICIFGNQNNPRTTRTLIFHACLQARVTFLCSLCLFSMWMSKSGSSSIEKRTDLAPSCPPY